MVRVPTGPKSSTLPQRSNRQSTSVRSNQAVFSSSSSNLSSIPVPSPTPPVHTPRSTLLTASLTDPPTTHHPIAQNSLPFPHPRSSRPIAPLPSSSHLPKPINKSTSIPINPKTAITTPLLSEGFAENIKNLPPPYNTLYSFVPSGIKNGFRLGIDETKADLPRSWTLPGGGSKPPKDGDANEFRTLNFEYIEKELSKGRLAGPYSLEEVETILGVTIQ
ncbi:hypothetical protein JCM5353_004278, partial [Sporobolomyces roseus]